MKLVSSMRIKLPRDIGMAQPFLPPPPSSSRRRNRLVSSENASLVQKSQLPQVQHSPAAQKTNDVSQPTQLVDFNSLPLASASCDDEYAWMNQDSQPHEQNSVFDFSSQAAQSQHPTHSTADAQLVTESRMDASAHPQQSSSVFEVNSGTLQSQSLFPNPSLQASNSPFVQPLQRPLFQQQPVLQQPIQQQPVLQQPVQQQPVLQQPIQQQPVLQQPVQQQPVLQQPVQQSLFQQQPVQQQSVQQPPFQQQSVQQLSVQQQSVQVHAVQQSVQQQGSPLLSFDQQQVLSQPAAGDWTAFAQPPAETSVVSESEIDDDIDFQISQMEQELAQLDAFASEYEAMDWGTQEQKVDVKATGIYDVPAFQTPGANVGQYQRQEQSTSQSPPVLFDFDSAFQFGQSVTVSQAPFPPQSTVSGQDPLRQEALYQEPSQIRVKKSMKLSGQPTAAGSKANQRTHKAIHTFVGRHDDEVELAKGDPVNVEVTGEDGWCTGINLRTNRRGIFPSSCVVTVSNPSQATGTNRTTCLTNFMRKRILDLLLWLLCFLHICHHSIFVEDHVT